MQKTPKLSPSLTTTTAFNALNVFNVRLHIAPRISVKLFQSIHQNDAIYTNYKLKCCKSFSIVLYLHRVLFICPHALSSASHLRHREQNPTKPIEPIRENNLSMENAKLQYDYVLNLYEYGCISREPKINHRSSLK